MSEEQREFLRFECLLPAEVVKIEGKDNLIERVTAHDFSREGLKLTISFNLDPGAKMELKLFLPEKKITSKLSGVVTWSKGVQNKMEVGLKIKEMDKKLKSEILNWVFPKWLEKERKKKQEP
jgi:c-di-GMP-binding flagellar brake protein YcgR